MNKPLEQWDNSYVQNLDVTERTSLELKGSDPVNHNTLGSAIGDVVSAFANFDGGHIIMGAKDPGSGSILLPDGKLPLYPRGKQSLKEWLESKVQTLSDPPVRNFDVKVFTLSEGNLAVIEIRRSENAPHQDMERKLFYGRNGSLCYPLTTTQIKDILQRQKSPIIEVSKLRVPSNTSSIAFTVANIGQTVIQSYFVQIQSPRKIKHSPIKFSEREQVANSGVKKIYLSQKGQEMVYIIEIEGGKLYPGQQINSVVASSIDSKHEEVESSENRIVLTLFSDPPAEIRGETVLEL